MERTDHRSPGHRQRAQRARVETYVRQRIPRSLVQGGERSHLCVCTRFIQDPSFRINVTGAPSSNEIRTSARFFSGFSTLGSSVSSRYRNPVLHGYQPRPRVPCTLSSLGTIVRRPSHVHHLRSRNQCIDIGITQLATRKSARRGVLRLERIQRSFTDFSHPLIGCESRLVSLDRRACPFQGGDQRDYQTGEFDDVLFGDRARGCIERRYVSRRGYKKIGDARFVEGEIKRRDMVRRTINWSFPLEERRGERRNE